MCLAYRASLSTFALTKFYTGLIRPHLEYCSSVWLNCGKGASDRPECIQLRAARDILRHQRCESNHSERLQALNLPTLAWRRRAHQLAMLWKLVNGHGPPRLLKELPQMCKDRCNHNLTCPLNFEVPLAHTSVLSRSFIVSSCIEWNKLPLHVQQCTSFTLFSKHLSLFYEHDRFAFGLPS